MEAYCLQKLSSSKLRDTYIIQDLSIFLLCGVNFI